MEKRQTKIMERVYCGVRFALMLDPRHAPKDGRRPVCVRVTFNYRQRYFLHGDTATETEFGRAARSGKGEAHERRLGWERFFDRVYGRAAAEIEGGTFSLASFSPLAVECGDGATLGDIYREYIGSLRAEGKESTANLYVSVLSKIEATVGDAAMSDVCVDFVRKFGNTLEREGLSEATRGIYLRNLRSVCNYAIHTGAMRQDRYPFSSGRYSRDRIRIPKGEARTEMFLGVDDMRKLYLYRGKHEKYVLMFLFSYLCNGANLVDVLNLRFDAHWQRSGGRELSFVRRKTQNTSERTIRIFVPVTEWLADVMGRLGVRERKGALLFPHLEGCPNTAREIKLVSYANKNIKKHLQAACAELGLPDGVSMTWARHSYKTNLIRQRVPDWFCEQMMGHSSGGVGAHYVGMFTAEDRMAYNSLLL